MSTIPTRHRQSVKSIDFQQRHKQRVKSIKFQQRHRQRVKSINLQQRHRQRVKSIKFQQEQNKYRDQQSKTNEARQNWGFKKLLRGDSFKNQNRIGTRLNNVAEYN